MNISKASKIVIAIFIVVVAIILINVRNIKTVREASFIESANLKEYEKHKSLRDKFIKGETLFPPKEDLSKEEWRELEFPPWEGHELREGDELALTRKKYWGWKSELHKYEKLTIIIPNTSTRKYTFPDDYATGAIIYYSRGDLSGFYNCFGYVKEGSIEIINIQPNAITAKLDLNIPLQSVYMPNKKCTRKLIRDTIEFERKSLVEP